MHSPRSISMPGTRFPVILLVLACLVLPVQVLLADQVVPQGLRLAYADDYKAVEILDQARQAVVPGPDLVLREGWTIKTGASAAELESTRDRTVFRLAPNTAFTIKTFKAKGSSEFSLGLGKLRIIAAKSKDGSVNLRINTPLASAGVRGTDFLLMAKPGLKDWICVREGLVEYTRQKDQVVARVAGGEYADATEKDMKSEKAGPDKLGELFAGMDFRMPGAPVPPAPGDSAAVSPPAAPGQAGGQAPAPGAKSP